MRILTGRYGKDRTCLPSTLIWYPSKPVISVSTNSLFSANGKGQSTVTFFVLPISLFNHHVAFDSAVPPLSSRIHFSHFTCPSTSFNRKRSRKTHYLQSITIHNICLELEVSEMCLSKCPTNLTKHVMQL